VLLSTTGAGRRAAQGRRSAEGSTSASARGCSRPGARRGGGRRRGLYSSKLQIFLRYTTPALLPRRPAPTVRLDGGDGSTRTPRAAVSNDDLVRYDRLHRARQAPGDDSGSTPRPRDDVSYTTSTESTLHHRRCRRPRWFTLRGEGRGRRATWAYSWGKKSKGSYRLHLDIGGRGPKNLPQVQGCGEALAPHRPSSRRPLTAGAGAAPRAGPAEGSARQGLGAGHRGRRRRATLIGSYLDDLNRPRQSSTPRPGNARGSRGRGSTPARPALERGDLGAAAAHLLYDRGSRRASRDFSDSLSYQNAEYDLIVAAGGRAAPTKEALGYADRVMLPRPPKAQLLHRRRTGAPSTSRLEVAALRPGAGPGSTPCASPRRCRSRPPGPRRGYLARPARAYEAGNLDGRREGG